MEKFGNISIGDYVEIANEYAIFTTCGHESGNNIVTYFDIYDNKIQSCSLSEYFDLMSVTHKSAIININYQSELDSNKYKNSYSKLESNKYKKSYSKLESNRVSSLCSNIEYAIKNDIKFTSSKEFVNFCLHNKVACLIL